MSLRAAVVDRIASQPRLLGALRSGDAWRLAVRLELLYTIQRKEPVIVFQMGKVGSSSVAASFPTDRFPVAVHTHHLSRQRIDEAVTFSHSAGLPVRRHFYHARVAAERVIDKGRPFKVISLVREPVGRSVSKFFHDFERFVGCPPERSTHSTEELVEIFLAKESDINDEAHWFEHQFEPAIGVDIYAHDFDPECGSISVRAGAGHALVMRLEVDDELKQEIIASFLGDASFTLDSANVGESRQYAATYRRFKSEAKLPQDYLDRKLSSRYATHFYSDRERTAIAERWA